MIWPDFAWSRKEKTLPTQFTVRADSKSAAISLEPWVQPSAFAKSLVEIKACSIDDKNQFSIANLKGESEYKQCMTQFNLDAEKSSNIFIIPQQSSLGSLNTTAACFQELTERLRLSPAISKVVDAFVPDSTGSDFYMGRGAIHFTPSVVKPGEKALEMCGLLKFVEKNDRGQKGVFGWSVRQMGFSTTYDVARKSEATILINPSLELWVQIKLQLKQNGLGRPCWSHWSLLPLVICSSLTANWSAYIGALHNAVAKMTNDVAMYNPDAERHKKLSTFDTDTLRDSSVYKDRLQHAAHVLRNNRETLAAMLKEAHKRQKRLAENADAEYEAFESGVEDIVRELQFLENQVQLIIARLDQTTASYRDVATFDNSNFMGLMTAKSIVEARAVRVIALLTFLFLPPTFTSSFLEMGYITVVSATGGRLLVKASSGLLFYLAITLPLIVVTVGGWLLWDWRTKAKARQMQSEYGSV